MIDIAEGSQLEVSYTKAVMLESSNAQFHQIPSGSMGVYCNLLLNSAFPDYKAIVPLDFWVLSVHVFNYRLHCIQGTVVLRYGMQLAMCRSRARHIFKTALVCLWQS